MTDSKTATIPQVTSLQQHEARRRAAMVRDAAYRVELTFTNDAERFWCRTTVTFRALPPDGAATVATFLDLRGASNMQVEVDGASLKPDCYEGNRIHLVGLAEGVHEVTVTADLPYATDGDGMFRYVDPADGNVYVCGFGGMDLAHRMFACFDQPDVKAPITLTVTAPQDWSVRANGLPTEARVVEAGYRTHEFATTQPISTYLFVVCAGPWASREWEFAGLRFGWHAKASLAEELDRDFADLRRQTEAYFQYYHNTFSQPFPFEHYHQVFAPGLNWGALETPGCVTFRDELVFLDPPSDSEKTRRAIIIAHEMAHMWFGNLVTMTWWEDTWLQESFADYMGYNTAAVAGGFDQAWTMFSAGRKINAYRADERRSTHPVAPDAGSITDVDAAATIFDAISYSKGTACLRQLVAWLGEDIFFTGLNNYLAKHAFQNAEFNDFVESLAAATDGDVRGWVQAWLRTSGFDTLRCVQRTESSTVWAAGSSRTHQVTFGSYRLADGKLTETRRVTCELPANATVDISCAPADIVIPNVDDRTFAAITLLPEHRAVIAAHLQDLPDSVSRAVVWWSLVNDVFSGTFTVAELVDVATAQVPAEPVLTLVELVISRVSETVGMLLPPDQVTTLWQRLADMCQRMSEACNDDEQRRVAAVTAYARLTSDALGLRSLLADKDTRMDIRWTALQRLCALGVATDEDIQALAVLDATSRGEYGAVRARASFPTRAAKQEAVARLCPTDGKAPDTRAVAAALLGAWQPEQADWLAEPLAQYMQAAPQAAAHSQALGGVVGEFFPRFMASAEVIDVIEAAVNTGLPAMLEREWNDAIDDMRRVLNARSAH